MNNATLVAVVDGVAQLAEPDGGLFLVDALLLAHGVQQIAARRFLHYDVHTSVRLDRLFICFFNQSNFLKTVARLQLNIYI